MRIDARRKSKHYLLLHAKLTSDFVQQFYLGERVERDQSNAVTKRFGELFTTLVVAMKVRALGREVRSNRNGEFAAGHDVHVETFFFDDFRNRRVGKGF